MASNSLRSFCRNARQTSVARGATSSVRTTSLIAPIALARAASMKSPQYSNSWAARTPSFFDGPAHALGHRQEAVIDFGEADLARFIGNHIVRMQQELQSTSDRIAANGADNRARIALHRHEQLVEEPDARPCDLQPHHLLDVSAGAEEATAASGHARFREAAPPLQSTRSRPATGR